MHTFYSSNRHDFHRLLPSPRPPLNQLLLLFRLKATHICFRATHLNANALIPLPHASESLPLPSLPGNRQGQVRRFPRGREEGLETVATERVMTC